MPKRKRFRKQEFQAIRDMVTGKKSKKIKPRPKPKRPGRRKQLA